MSQAITITLSEPVYNRLKRTAELSQQPIETVVEQSLSHSLPALLDEVPPEYQADIYPLLQMDQAELLAEAKQVFDTERWAKYESLLTINKQRVLSNTEREALNTLRREADSVMYRKAYSAVLLKQRGYPVPRIDELPTPA